MSRARTIKLSGMSLFIIRYNRVTQLKRKLITVIFMTKPVMLTSKYSSIDPLQHSHVKKVGPPDWAKLVPMVEQSSSRRVKRPRLRCLRPERMTGRGCPGCLGGMVMLNRRGKKVRLYMEVDGRVGLTSCRIVYTVLELEVMAIDRHRRKTCSS